MTKSETIMERIRSLNKEPQKDQILRELNALLQATPASRKNARSYIQNAINYIERG